MNCMELAEKYGSSFRVIFDEAAFIEPGGKKDPWYCQIPCKHGQVYPYSNDLLAVHSKGSKIRKQLASIARLSINNWADDGEAIFLFKAELFGHVAAIVKPKRKKRLSEQHRQKSIAALNAYRKLPQKACQNEGRKAVNRAISSQTILGLG